MSTAMNLSTGTVWKITKKTLRKYSYKPNTVQSFTDQHKLCRVIFAIWFYSKTNTSAITLCGLMKSCGWKNPQNFLPELVNTVERYAANLNRNQIITAENDILLKTQAFIESDWGAFEYRLKSFTKKRSQLFLYCGYFSLKCPTLGNTNNIIITI